jgi:cell division protein FtsQ
MSSRPQPPASSRLTVKPRPNRRRPSSLWSRVPKPAAVADACGRALRRSLPALAGAGVLAALGGSAWAGYRFVTTSDRFAIAHVTIEGNRQLSDDQIAALVPARMGDNVFAADLEGVARELRAHPWIAQASARRVLPDTLAIEIRERVPAALAELGGLYLVDASGHAFKRAALEADEGAGLPIITGLGRRAYLADPAAAAAQLREALAALALWQAHAERPSIGELHLDAHGALVLVTYEQAIAIQLGSLDSDLAARMRTFDVAWAELAPSERARVRAVHLDTRPDHVTVALAPNKDQ